MTATNVLEGILANLNAGIQLPPPPTDPVVLTSQLTSGLDTKLNTQIVDNSNVVDTSKSSITSFRIGLGTAVMPTPSGDKNSDVARFLVEKAKNTRYIEHQDGTYLHDGSQINLAANQKLVGHGSGRTTWLLNNKISPGSTIQAMFLCLDANASEVGIEGLTIDAGDYAEPYNYWAPIVFRGCSGVELIDLNIVRFPRFGLVVNSGSKLIYERGSIIRSLLPKDSTGNTIASGQQSQAILVSESAGPCVGFKFFDIYAKGSGHNASGSYFYWERCEVDGFNFGSGFTLEQAATCHHHKFIHCVAHGGRGTDSNQTVAGAFELWGKFGHNIIRSRSYDNDGYALTLGAPNSLVYDCSFEDIGRLPTAAGVGFSNGVSGSYNAAGSVLKGNNYIPAAGNSNWNIAKPLSWSTLDSSLSIEISDTISNFFPNSFPPTTLWTGKGAIVTGHTPAYSNLNGPSQTPVGVTVAGIKRSLHKVEPVTFIGDDGSSLPSGLVVYADVNADNNVNFLIANVDRSTNSMTFPAGTFIGRITSR
jgi:hypothetical protein